MSDEILRVGMLGGFTMAYGETRIPIRHYGTSRMMQLLQIILLSGHNGIDKEELAEKLYGDDEMEDAGATLRVNVYRLRKYFEKLKLLETSDLIWFQSGGYRWNDYAVPVELDTDVFMNSANTALAAYEEWKAEAKRTEENPEEEQQDGSFEYKGTERVLDLLQDAIWLYGGDFLPEIRDVSWAQEAGDTYRKAFDECMDAAKDILSGLGRDEELLQLSEHALEVSYTENYLMLQIDCLMELGRTAEAMRVYEKAATYFLEGQGLQPFGEIMDRFSRMRDRIRHSASTVREIQSNLQEDEFKSGAYFCTYPGFMDCYHIVCRLLERSGQSAYLMLCAPYKNGEEIADPAKLPEVLDKMKSAIGNALRRGDSFTRYGANQFLILLVGIKLEDCVIVQRRIDRLFEDNGIRGKVRIGYEVYPANENDTLPKLS